MNNCICDAFKNVKDGGAPIGSWSSGGTKNTIVNEQFCMTKQLITLSLSRIGSQCRRCLSFCSQEQSQQIIISLNIK